MAEHRTQRPGGLLPWPGGGILPGSSAAGALPAVGWRAWPGLGVLFGMTVHPAGDEPRRDAERQTVARRGRSMGVMAEPPQDEGPPRALLERARAGDADAIAELFALHQDEVRRLCRRMMDEPASAEDAVSVVVGPEGADVAPTRTTEEEEELVGAELENHKMVTK